MLLLGLALLDGEGLGLQVDLFGLRYCCCFCRVIGRMKGEVFVLQHPAAAAAVQLYPHQLA